MSEHPPLPEDQVDDLVRAYLRRKAQQSDAATGLQRVRATLGAARPRRRPWWLAAAVVGLALLAGGLYFGSGRASAEALVRQALQAHAMSVDRCYLVETQPDSGSPLWQAMRQSRLWTRGDRFWIESSIGPRQWSWGRDEEGQLWLAVSANRGLRYEAGEAPETLAFLCDVYSMKIETLLGDVLANFDLQREEAEPGTYRIRAELKPGHSHPSLRSAVLEIDAETKVLKKIVLARNFRGRPTKTATFTLIDSRNVDDSRYQLEGHLTAPYQIFSRSFEPQRRRELLFGRAGAREPD